MKNFKNLITETLNSTDMEELESAADLFQYGLDHNFYSRLQQQEFNNTYWNLKNKFITNSIINTFKNLNSLDLYYMVSKAPVNIKENKTELIKYVNNIIKNLKKSKVA